MKSVLVTLIPGQRYQQKVDTARHTLVCDIDVASGGADGGPDPKDLVLGGLGSCVAMTIVMVGARKKWDLQALSVKVTQTDEPDPKNPGQKRLVITEDIQVKGNLTQQELDDIKSTAKKCPVYKLLTEPKRMNTVVTHTAPPAPTAGTTASPQAPAKP